MTIQKSSRLIISATWDDVPHLTEKAKRELLAGFPAHQRDARSKGIPSLGSGAIYPVSEDDIKVDPFKIPPHWPRAFGLDVGWKRTAAIWLAHDRDQDVIYLYTEHYRGHVEAPVHATAIKARGDWIPGAVDPASNSAGQKDGERLLEMYRKLGLKLTKADNAVEAGIYETWTRLSTGRLRVFSTCSNWFEEFRLYRRDEKGKIVKDFDHLMDATRYAIMTGAKIAKPVPAQDHTGARHVGFVPSDPLLGY